ncbi:MAG: NAD-dependent DNA ligase LigA [Aeriscardovia sp.]|nr:NAD-dependent DNA ligase LigA [Aeriscardovia sp.]
MGPLTGTDRDVEILAGKDLEKLNLQEAEELHKSLASFIERDRDLYYNSSDPVASDNAYDARMAAFKRLEEIWPSLSSPLPSQVGARPSGETLVHPSKMLSLEDVFSREELEAWYGDTSLALGEEGLEVSCEVKIDGLAVDLVYEDGILTSASTRGDGSQGEDITENAMAIPSIPQRLGGESRASFLEVRGEAFMRFDDFNELNERRQREGKPPFANPRNAAAGSLRQKNSRDSSRRLSFLAHGVGRAEWKGEGPRRLSDVYSFYESSGLPVSPNRSVETSFEGVWEMAEKLGEKRNSLEHPLDGMVVKVNELSFEEKLGATSHAPRWAVAFKYPAQEAHTLLKDVAVQVGRTGKVTPIAVLDPVLLAGSTVSRATLHNGEVVEKKQIMIGDTVVVKKAGDIIPEVVSPVLSARDPERVKPFSMPSLCPYCGTKLVRSEEGEGADLVCPNREGCPAQIVGRLLYISGRKIFDIDELGEESATALAWPEKGRPSPEKYLPGVKEVVAEGAPPTPSPILPAPQKAALSSEAGLFSLTAEDLLKVEVWREIPRVETFEEGGKKEKRILGGSGYFDRIPLFRSSSGQLRANAGKMLEQISRARGVDLARFLSALCIKHLGPNTAKLVAARYKDAEEVSLAGEEDFEAVKGVGEKTARAMAEYFKAAKDPKSFEGKIFSSWLAAGLGGGGGAGAAGGPGPLSGLTFVVTGTLDGFSRREVEEKIEAEGGKASSSVSSKTDYLLAGRDPGSKLAKAEALGVKIIGEEEFEKLLKR